MIGGLGLGLLVAMLLVAWRLTTGPVSIGFLTPYIKNALAEVYKGGVNVSIDDTILTWAGWERTLDIRIVNLHTTLPSGEDLARVPEVSISLSAKALVRGVVAPRSIEFFGPSFRLVRDQDGHLALGLMGAQLGSDGKAQQASNDFVASMILLMLQDPDPSQAMSYLKRMSIVSGDLSYEDQALGTTLQASNANAHFTRVQGGLEAELDLNLQAGDKVAAVSILGGYSVAGKRIDLGVSFEKVNPADFASLSPRMEALGALDIDLSGTTTLSMDQGGRIEGIGFDLSGAKGSIALPVSLAAQLDILAWAQRVAVDELHIQGRYEGSDEVLDINNLDMTLRAGENLYLPAPINHELPLKMLKTALSYAGDTGKLDVKDMQIGLRSPSIPDSEGPVANLTLAIEGLLKGPVTEPESEGERAAEAPPFAGLSLDLTGSVRNVAFNDLDSYWPKDLGIDARMWVIPNLRDGVAEHASVHVALRSDVGVGGGLALTALEGEIQASGLTVDYLAPMPPGKNAHGSATFTAERFDIKIDGADAFKGLKVLDGQVSLLKLQEDLPEADIQLKVSGPVPAALALIDHEPLGFASIIGLNPKGTDGTVTTNISLKLPLKADLLAEEVIAKADAHLSKARIKDSLFHKDLEKGDLQLTVTNDALDLKGTAVLGDVPVQIGWSHDFRGAALFRDHYEISGTIKEVLNLGALGIEVPDILARYMRGGAQANVNYTELSDGRQSLSARVDLANIHLAAPELGWDKPQGVPGIAVMELRLKGDVPVAIPKFSVSAPNMNIAGSVQFSKSGQLARVDIDTMRSGHTDVSGSLTPLKPLDANPPLANTPWELVLRGESLDVGLLWDEMLGIRDVSGQENLQDDNLMLDVAVDIRNVLIRKDRIMTDLIGSVYRENGQWRKLDVVGVVGEGERQGSIELMLDTDTDGLRYLSIASDKAGSALKTLDLYDNILGGTFDLKAAYTEVGKDAPLEGVVKVKNYAMIEAPAFAKLIGIMSLTGVLDALQGDGLNFDIFEAPFKLEKGVLHLTDARASGPTIGITASGTVNMDQKLLDIKGTVVPAYMINALLGKIPLIGELFTGPEKGGGLFAATYTMKGVEDNVEITVNPLSALAPGVLRGIFTDSGKETETPQGPKTPTIPPTPKSAPSDAVTPAPIK
ncbi:YhdP family protein [Magnetovibrio blakemorei]|uniref:YhdP central domain-containing protein n=1 Tax=Magnetovibrio blakemorei TaxID=28181 RepID=A0A1E5Q537_9PROT|nr:AsmA-like C-terminal region-containing protein [Magnetovibrio blakemorei]OEJ65223.1 hypothetical protein BEN30_15230 [Magnetovibrio blakemorei]